LDLLTDDAWEIPMTRFRCLVILLAVLGCSAHAGLAHGADKPTTETFDADGVKISYSIQGKGEPVVLIHGWFSSGWMNWTLPGTTALLARDYQVITLDVRGHGSSDKPTKEEAYGPELVEDVARLLDHLKIKKAHIVGYSMGGIITAKFLARHPDRALSGTLGGMGWLKEGSVPQTIFSQIGKKDARATGAVVCGRSLAKLALTEEELKSIRVPVMVLIGDKDDLKKLYVEPLQKVRKDWAVVEIKDANHITCILKKPFRDEIAAWIKKNSK
jgi:pimeloyl-ACP methyl ester carboxylesterase